MGGFDRAKFASSPIPRGTVRIAARSEIAGLSRWRTAFAGERKDHRFYELVEDTLKDGFDYGYLIVDDGKDICAIQPFFVLDQDLAGRRQRSRQDVYRRDPATIGRASCGRAR